MTGPTAVPGRFPLAVIGAGPGGLEAAATAAEHGVETLLVDAYARAGGQYYRQLPAEFSAPDRTRRQAEATELARRVSHPSIRYLSGTLTWGIFPCDDNQGWELAVHGPHELSRVVAKRLILAPGAYDRPVPFPGWTLPGVMTAGAVQGLIKSQRVMPGSHFLLSGTGPLQLAVAAALVRAGGEVVAVLEAAHIGWRDLRYAPAAAGQWERLAEGWEYLQVLRTLTRSGARVPVRRGWSVVAAHGTEQVEAATIARLDQAWQPISSSEQRIVVDAIVTGYGFVPANELSRLVGCEHVHRPDEGGWVPVRDDEMRTTQPGIYVVGDAGGMGGAVAARMEGRIAACSAARDLLGTGKAERGLADARSRLARERRFARMTAALFTPGSGLDALATDETIICRCEGVTLGEIKAAVRDGARTASEVKGVTCAGMGNCQGRICGTMLPRLVARELAALGLLPPAATEPLTVRPPVHPLPLTALAGSAQAKPPAAVHTTLTN